MTREEKSRVVLEQFEIPFYEDCRTVDEAYAVLRSPHDIAKRAVTCLFSLQIAGDMYYGKNVRESKKYFLKLLQNFEAVEYLTPNESRFVFETPSREEAADMLWKYEACQVLLWASGLTAELDFPDFLCDSSQILGTVLSFSNFQSLMDHVRPRPLSVILDETDIVCRMDYACVKASAESKEIPAGLSREILHERKLALLWMIRGDEPFYAWDDELI